MTGYHRHRIGDGLHYINNTKRVTDDGSQLPGETSFGCILLNLEYLLTYYGMPCLSDLWTDVYPKEPLSDAMLFSIMLTNMENADGYDPRNPRNIADVLEDVRSVGRDHLADRVLELLAEKWTIL
jgi:hypothetical protein